MYERILIPLDGSREGESAVAYVEGLVSKLAQGITAEITLLQIVSSLVHNVVGGGVSARIPFTEQEIEQIQNKAIDYLEKTGEGLRSKGAIVKTKVGIGVVADAITKAADEANVDLIAMSTHGRSGINRWAFGSVTDRVLRGGSKPMLVVRASKEATST